MADAGSLLCAAVGAEHVLAAGPSLVDYSHDEALGLAPGRPAFVVRPGSTAEVAAVLRIAGAQGLTVTARGSGTGLSGGAAAGRGGLVLSFERMDQILEIDTSNQVAVVQPGVTLAALDSATAECGLVYPVFPGEMGASLGGTIATNAGGMRAVKYGVTRQHVLGLEAVLASGEVIRTGGKHVKTSSGYNLTQLIIGSEGTLALVTEATIRLYPRLPCQAALLAPFTSLEQVSLAAVGVVASGARPLILEYVDMLTMAAIADEDVGLGVPASIRESAQAYLLVASEERTAESLDADMLALADLLTELGAADVYLLPVPAARRLIEAREKAFWAAKSAGADEIVDAVVPLAAMAGFLSQATRLGSEAGGLIVGCGHAGDGNVHLAVFQPDPAARTRLLREIYSAALALGGAISGEHGIGTAKKGYFLELTDPLTVGLMRRVKQAFDPQGILAPGNLFDGPPGPA